MHTMASLCYAAAAAATTPEWQAQENNIWHIFACNYICCNRSLALSLLQWGVQRATLCRWRAGQPSPQGSVDPIHRHHVEFCDTATRAPGRTGR